MLVFGGFSIPLSKPGNFQIHSLFTRRTTGEHRERVHSTDRCEEKKGICMKAASALPTLGLAGRSDHPDVQAAVAEGRKKVLAAGKVLIGEPSDAASAKQMIADRILLISTYVQGMWVNTTRA